MELMGLTFHPRMKALFQDHDSATYGNFRCQTCHGEDMEARRFTMPATLRPLPRENAVDVGRARDAKATEFMVQKVMPATRELLANGDPSVAASFGCGSCHPSQ